MVEVYHRQIIAQQMAQQLLKPRVLDLPLRSGLFLSGLRRTGKTTFLRQDLIPALESGDGTGRSAVVIYVDLWTNPLVPPVQLILRAIRAKLCELEDPRAAVWSALKRVTSAQIAAGGLRFRFDLSKLGEEHGATLAEAFAQVIDQAQTDLVLIVDEVQQCLGREDAQSLMQSLKAARDAINLRPATPGHFLFIGTGSHRSLVQEMTVRRKEAFVGAVNLDYPVLDEGFVSWVLERLRTQGETIHPSSSAAWQGFKDLGHRPEPFIEAQRILSHTVQPGDDIDAIWRGIVWAKRDSLADLELAALEDLGPLAQLVFNRIAAHDGDEARGIYSSDALEGYRAALGQDLRTEEVQTTVVALLEKNLICRTARGTYSITDPFVRQVWLERERPGVSGP